MITVKKGIQANIRTWFHKRTVWIFNANSKTKRKFVLLIRKDEDGGIRYSLANSNKCLVKLAFM